MGAKERLALREPVEGPNGSFMVDFENREYSIKRIVDISFSFRGKASTLQQLDYVESHPTVEQAKEAARNLAGLQPVPEPVPEPVPDRRGAIAHTKEMMK